MIIEKETFFNAHCVFRTISSFSPPNNKKVALNFMQIMMKLKLIFRFLFVMSKE